MHHSPEELKTVLGMRFRKQRRGGKLPEIVIRILAGGRIVFRVIVSDSVSGQCDPGIFIRIYNKPPNLNGDYCEG